MSKFELFDRRDEIERLEDRIAELEGEVTRLREFLNRAGWDDEVIDDPALKEGDTGKRPDFSSLPKVCPECGHQYEPWDEHCTKCADTKEGDT